MTIDMKDFIPGDNAPAAVEQTVVDTNSYQQEVQEEFPMPEIPAEPVAQAPLEQPPVKQEDPQEKNFRALAEKVDQLKAERESEKREYQLQLDMMRANMANKATESAPKAKRMFENMQDNDVPNVSEIRSAWEERESQYQARIEELQVAQQFPDYAEVLEKYTAPLLKTDPSFAEGLYGAKNKALFAYKQGVREKMLQEAQAALKTQQPAAPQKSALAQKIVENSRKPTTLAQAGGQTVLGKADYYATMSDRDFMEFASKNLGEI